DKIVNYLKPDSMILFNESFAATNEREGSEIGRQITSALIEKNIKVFFVTHMYELAHGFYKNRSDGFLFLRAERSEDGNRTFKILNGEPLQTSYGVDLYKKIFSDQRSSIEV
ncbi:MAG: MutS-related protein, partial [Athalassotoga sp.]